MSEFRDVFGDDPICKYAYSHCEYDGESDVACGKINTSGTLFCHEKCENYTRYKTRADSRKEEEVER